MPDELAVVAEYPDTPEQRFNRAKRELITARARVAAQALEDAGRGPESSAVRRRAFHFMVTKYPPILILPVTREGKCSSIS